jgi:outer membrane receptor protein involved in Fe transport
MPSTIRLLCISLLILHTLPAFAQGTDELPRLPEVVITGERLPRLEESASQFLITPEDIQLQPPARPGNILRIVPGFVTIDHSGGGVKADQYLLRGFDADHGTDVAFFMDGMPINVRSHAHGQGYTDLNFVIPESLQDIDVSKGPYFVEYGDFAVAGAVNFLTREMVEQNQAEVSFGTFNTQRYLTLLSPTKGAVRSFVALEGFLTDGPYDNPNNYHRFNGLAKLTMNPIANSELTITGSYYRGESDASGQIPLRAVDDGIISRFGSIDPNEGGNTQRTTGRVRFRWDARPGGTAFANIYAQYYQLDLFSNFTFFLNDPVNGDGIEQNDNRYIYGGHLGYRQSGSVLGIDSAATLGFQARVDDGEVRLGRQRQRQRFDTTTSSDLFEASYSPYLKLEFQPYTWMRFVGGLRADVYQFDVQNRCPTCIEQPEGETSANIVNWKANLILGPWYGTEFFLNYGTGFHSNDARAVVTDPGLNPLPRATGYEVGFRTRQFERIEFSAAFWLLYLDSELVFVGDEGVTEASDATKRLGVELFTRIKLLDWLWLRGDVTSTSAEFRGSGDPIPLAPRFTWRGDLTARLPFGLAATLQATHLGKRPLTENDGVYSQPFTVVDLITRFRLPYKVGPGYLEPFLLFQNLTNTNYRQAQFFFESRLRREPEAVADIHFTPGAPLGVLGGVGFLFQAAPSPS